MKRTSTIIPLLSLLLMAACGGNPQKETTAPGSTPAVTVTPISDLLASDTTSVGSVVVTEGVVTHVCSHSGKRCFIEDSLGLSIRVEAKGEIGNFNRELIGTKIRAKGLLRVAFLDKQRIGKMEANISKREEHGDCSAQRKSIERMKEWMSLNNSDRYPVFYIDGEEYEVITETR